VYQLFSFPKNTSLGKMRVEQSITVQTNTGFDPGIRTKTRITRFRYCGPNPILGVTNPRTLDVKRTLMATKLQRRNMRKESKREEEEKKERSRERRASKVSIKELYSLLISIFFISSLYMKEIYL